MPFRQASRNIVSSFTAFRMTSGGRYRAIHVVHPRTKNHPKVCLGPQHDDVGALPRRSLVGACLVLAQSAPVFLRGFAPSREEHLRGQWELRIIVPSATVTPPTLAVTAT